MQTVLLLTTGKVNTQVGLTARFMSAFASGTRSSSQARYVLRLTQYRWHAGGEALVEVTSSSTGSSSSSQAGASNDVDSADSGPAAQQHQGAAFASDDAAMSAVSSRAASSRGGTSAFVTPRVSSTSGHPPQV